MTVNKVLRVAVARAEAAVMTSGSMSWTCCE